MAIWHSELDWKVEQRLLSYKVKIFIIKIIYSLEHDFYLITMQVCRADSVQTNEKKTEGENKIEWREKCFQIG